MKIQNDSEWRNGNYLSLGVQSTPDEIFKDMLNLAYSWSPNKTKSFSFQNYYDTDYHGSKVDKVTGYANVEVVYFTSKKEGDYPIVRNYADAMKRYNKIFTQYQLDYAGGGQFGFDWPTIKLNRPETYWELKKMLEIMRDKGV